MVGSASLGTVASSGRPPLPEAVEAPRSEFLSTGGGRVAFYSDTAGAGRPLVLVHSINAASSSFEMKPLFDHYRGVRPVYSLDLPGFGHSDRSDRAYSPDVYAAAVADLLRQIVRQPADVVALSLSAEFAARSALTVPECFASLVLISPTGFDRQSLPSPGAARWIHKVLTLPWLGQGLYDLVASRPSVRHFLNRSFLGQAPVEMVDYAYATSHQPGARHAPLTFLSSQLFTRDAADLLYGRLTDLTALVIADRDPYIRFDRLPEFVALHRNWQAISLAPHLGLPHWEKLAETVAALDRFWAGQGA